MPGVIDQETRFRPAPIWAQGAAVFYAPGIMSATARARGLSLSGYLGGVALMSCSDIGQEVWLRRPGEDWEGPFLVVDCAAWLDQWAVINFNKEIVEVGFETALRWGMVKRYGRKWQTVSARLDGVEVSKVLPSRLGCYLEPVDYVSWWNERATFAERYINIPNSERRTYIAQNNTERQWLYDCLIARAMIPEGTWSLREYYRRVLAK